MAKLLNTTVEHVEVFSVQTRLQFPLHTDVRFTVRDHSQYFKPVRLRGFLLMNRQIVSSKHLQYCSQSSLNMKFRISERTSFEHFNLSLLKIVFTKRKQYLLQSSSCFPTSYLVLQCKWISQYKPVRVKQMNNWFDPFSILYKFFFFIKSKILICENININNNTVIIINIII